MKERNNNSFWNVVNCRCEFKKVVKLITTEECDIETNDIVGNKTTSGNSITKKQKIVNHCCLKYFICLRFSNINWNYDLFLFKIEK